MADQITKPVAPDYTKYRSLTDWYKDYIRYWQKFLQYKGFVGRYQTAAYFYLPSNIAYFAAATGLSSQGVVVATAEVLKSLGIDYPAATVYFDCEKLYNQGKDFLDIFNAVIVANEPKENYIEYAGAFKEFRRDMYNRLPDLDFKENKSGYIFDYWSNCDTIYPKMQITKETKRLFFWDAKADKVFYNKTAAGRFFFEPMFLLPPEDQQSLLAGGGIKTIEGLPNFYQLKVMQGNDGGASSNLVKVGNFYYLKVLDHDDAFCFLLQYHINRLMTEPFSTYAQQPGSGTDQTRIGYALLNMCTSSGSVEAEKKSYADIDFLNVPVYKKNLLDKVLLGFTAAVAVALTIVTAGAGTPLLAAAVGSGAKQMLNDATSSTGAEDKAKSDAQSEALKEAIADAEAQKAAGKSSNILIIVIIAVIIIAATYFVIKNKRK